MRIPQPRVGQPIQTTRGGGGGRATQPSGQRVAGGTTGPQGTPGGRKAGTNGRPLIFGQEVYLWILVLIEAACIGVLRRVFRRFHGG